MKTASTDAVRRALILEGSLLKTIIILALPNMLVGLVQALTPFVDSLFIYNLAGDKAGASVAFAGPILNLVQAFGIGLGSAGLAIIGQANGSGDRVKARGLSRRFLYVVLATGFVAAIVLLAFAGLAVAPLGPELAASAVLYLQMTAFGLPFMYFGSAYNAIALGYGRAEKTLYRALINLVVKIVADIVFVLILKGGVMGAAWATLLSTVVASSFMATDLISWSKKSIADDNLAEQKEKFHLPMVPFVLKLFKLGFPATLVQASNSLSFYFMNNEAARFGTEVLNGFGIANTINSIFFAPPSSIGSAVAATSAITSGAQAFDRARLLARAGLWLSIGTSLLFTGLLFPLSEFLSSLFTRTPNVLMHAAEAMRYFSVSLVGFAIFNVIAGAFSGIGRTDVPLWIAVARIWVLRIPVVFLALWLWPVLAEKAVWISMAVSNFATAGFALLLFRHIKWDHKALGKLDK